MSCNYGKIDCTRYGTDLCNTCFGAYNYVQVKSKNKTFGTSKIKIKDTGRMGAISETKSFNQLEKALSTTVTGTPNSGAAKVKGDIQIRGIINVMEEIKTTTKKNEFKEAGKESFTIKREWLTKLSKEARAEEMEFYYLKFSFKENDDMFYSIIDMEVLMDIMLTIKHDRIQAKIANNKIDSFKKHSALKEAENTKLKAEIEYLNAKIKEIEESKNMEDLI